MTDLTEQMKKGELPEGHYYVKDGEDMIAEYLDGYFYNNGNPMTSFSGGVDSVLEKVPSYEKFLSLTYAKEEDEKIIAEYEKENEKLKELLEWCRDELFEVYSNEVSHPEDVPIIKKLDEVLK